MPWKKPLVPYYVLSAILYSEANWLLPARNKPTVTLKLGPMSRALSLKSERLREALKYLHDQGLLTELKLCFGLALVTPRTSRNFPFLLEEENND